MRIIDQVIVTDGVKAQVGSAVVRFPVARSFVSTASRHSPNGAAVGKALWAIQNWYAELADQGRAEIALAGWRTEQK